MKYCQKYVKHFLAQQMELFIVTNVVWRSHNASWKRPLYVMQIWQPVNPKV